MTTTRRLILLFALLLAAMSYGAPTATAQTQEQQDDLTDLWERYPLDAPADEPRPLGTHEEGGSKAGSPADEPEPGSMFALSLLFVAMGLAVVGVAGGVYQGVSALRRRRRGGSVRSGSVAPSRAKNHQA
jgi:hypothetical protein